MYRKEIFKERNVPSEIPQNFVVAIMIYKLKSYG